MSHAAALTPRARLKLARLIVESGWPVARTPVLSSASGSKDSALPAPDQRQDRTIPPHPGLRLGLQTLLPLRSRPPQSPTRLAARLQPPPTPHRDRQGRTHHPV